MADCPSCGKVLATDRAMRQHHSQVHDERLPNKECNRCSESFYDGSGGRKFCDSCPSYSGKSNGNWSGGKTESTCISCGSIFKYYESEKDGKYCPNCADNSWGNENLCNTKGEDNPLYKNGQCTVVETECKVCGEKVDRKKRNAENRTTLCSNSCKSEWAQEKYSGDGNPMWKGGYHKKWYNNKKWKNVRENAKERDNHNCQRCGSTEMLDVHHITPVREFNDYMDAHYLENVVTLCRSCHRKVEVGEAEI